MLSRARWAGIAGALLSLIQGGIAWADWSAEVHAWAEACATCIIFIGSALLVLFRDPRCQPKIDRLNAILLKALAKDLHVDDEVNPK